MTSFIDQFCNLGIRQRAPSRVKYLRDLEPLCESFLGNRPSNSIICAKWSSFFPNCSLVSFLGLNSSSPVSISKTIHAKDHISADRLYFDPVRTYGPRYCRVWIYVAKWWCYQHAFPKSAILTLNPSYSFGPLSKTSLVSKAENNYCSVFWTFAGFWGFYLCSFCEAELIFFS